MQSLYLLMGCFGLKEDDFVHCSSVENVIFQLIDTNLKYQLIMDLFDKYNLFDKIIVDYNIARRFLFELDNLSDIKSRVLSEADLRKYQKFTSMHHLCGIYIKLSLQSSLSFELEKNIFIAKSK